MTKSNKININAVVSKQQTKIKSKKEDDQSAQEILFFEQIEDLKTNRGLRKYYARKVYQFLVVYCVVVVIFLLLQGFSICDFNLPVSVLVTIAGSTTVSAIGLVGLVIKGLFEK